MKITNRYGDEFTFTLLEDGNVQWSGEFEYCRFGFPNDYTLAYEAYVNTEGMHDRTLSMSRFKEAVHKQEDSCHVYARLVDSVDEINMVDPSGGPYMTEGMEILGKTIYRFERNEEGYLIITK